VNYYRHHRDNTFSELGNNFGFSKQAVSQFLKATNWEAIDEGEKLLQTLLKDV